MFYQCVKALFCSDQNLVKQATFNLAALLI